MFFTLLKDKGYLDLVMQFMYCVTNIMCPSALESTSVIEPDPVIGGSSCQEHTCAIHA